MHRYELRTDWRVPGRLTDVQEILGEVLEDVGRMCQFWPEANVECTESEPGDATGDGKVVEMRTKGFLPYRLRWRVRVSTLEPLSRYSLRTSGDFEGTGVWSFAQEGNGVVVRFDWRVRVQKPVLRLSSFLLKPLFVANHRWAMARGRRRFAAELALRGAARRSGVHLE